MGILNHKGITWQGENLIIAVEPAEKMAIEEILEDYSYTVCWQSKYNSYCNFYEQPFCEDGFIVNYIVEGNHYLLLLLRWKIEQRDKQIKQLENCLG